MFILKEIRDFEKNILCKKTISKKDIKEFIEKLKYARLKEKFISYKNVKDYNFKNWKEINNYEELNNYFEELGEYYEYWQIFIDEKYYIYDNEEDKLFGDGKLKEGFNENDFYNELKELGNIFDIIMKIQDKLYFLKK